MEITQRLITPLQRTEASNPIQLLGQRDPMGAAPWTSRDRRKGTAATIAIVRKDMGLPWWWHAEVGSNAAPINSGVHDEHAIRVNGTRTQRHEDCDLPQLLP
mgnify:CR=1 FL=1